MSIRNVLLQRADEVDLHSKGWFDQHFAQNIPDNIRSASEAICRQFTISGTSDPMYVANIIALELRLGDGQGKFSSQHGAEAPGFNDGDVKGLAGRLRSSYSKNINGAGTAEIVGIISQHIPLPSFEDKLAKILAGGAIIDGDDFLDNNELPDNVVSIPNPGHFGEKYLIGLTSYPYIRSFRIHAGIDGPLDQEEWLAINYDELQCMAAESGADRELCFDRVRYEDAEYERYLTRFAEGDTEPALAPSLSPHM